MKRKNVQWFSILALSVLHLVACSGHGTVYEYYDSDHKRLYKKYEINKETGKMDGTYKEYDENGNLEIESSYKDGRENGIYKWYYSDGALMIEGSYKDGRKDGIYKWYYGDGTLMKESSYKDGRKDGIYKVYGENETLMIEAPYKDGRKNGIQKEYGENGNLIAEISFRDGSLDGSFEIYDEDGKLVYKGVSPNDNPERTQFFTDSRDNQTYPLVTMGKQVWMATNLNYKTSDSFCYNDYEPNCSMYGRLYTWKAALEACPAGWHLPSIEEFRTLYSTTASQCYYFTNLALKSARGWGKEHYGLDVFGFSVLPAGQRDGNGVYDGEGVNAFFWSSSETDGYLVDEKDMRYDKNVYVFFAPLSEHLIFLRNDGKKHFAFSVRCLKD